MKLAEVFAKNARARMEALGLTQQDVARALGVSRPLITNYLSGSVDPGATVLQAWAGVLKCTVSDLLGDAGRPIQAQAREPRPEEMAMFVIEKLGLEDDQEALIRIALGPDTVLVKNLLEQAEAIEGLKRPKSSKKGETG